MWRRSVLILAIAAPAWAHTVSMSTGELRIDGPLAEYELRIPMYEVAPMANPSSILDHIVFEGGHRVKAKCADEDGTFVCHASYEFENLVRDHLNVECTFFEVTVPNHVHWLTATRGANTDQEVFDKAFPHSELHFRPPSRLEAFGRAFGMGLARAATNWIGLLFLLGLAVAAPRAWRPFLGFAAGEFLAIYLGPKIPWTLPARFLEAAMALTVAYLAVEILMAAEPAPLAYITAFLGIFHGLSLAGFPASYVSAAAILQLAAFALFAMAMRFVPPSWRKASSWGLLVAGLGAFAARVIVQS